LLKIDYLLIVSDCSVRGVRTAKRIADLTQEMGTPVANHGLIVNRVPGGILPEGVKAEVEATGLPLLQVIKMDDNVAALDADGSPVGNIPSDSACRVSIDKLMSQLI
jgi:CO dehydrogenase maturation factor